MQNGVNAFSWVNPSTFTSGQKSQWPGYQGVSLHDLFLKKNGLYQSGISQLAAASSYLEKMTSLSGDQSTGGSQQHQSHQIPPQTQQQLQQIIQKCPHQPDSKDKYPCEICIQQYSIAIKEQKLIHDNNGGSHHLLIPQQLQNNIRRNDSLNSGNASHNGIGHSSNNSSHSTANGTGNVIPTHQQLVSQPQTTSRGRSASSTAVKQFPCPICNKAFTQKGNLKTHMMIHTGEKPFSCTVCGKSFTQKGNVDTHMKIHTGQSKSSSSRSQSKDKPYVCGFCGKMFSQKGNLTAHLRTHNKDERFPCTGNLKTHMQKHNCNFTSKANDQSMVDRFLPMHQSLIASTFSLPETLKNSLRNDQSPAHQGNGHRSNSMAFPGTSSCIPLAAHASSWLSNTQNNNASHSNNSTNVNSGGNSSYSNFQQHATTNASLTRLINSQFGATMLDEIDPSLSKRHRSNAGISQQAQNLSAHQQSSGGQQQQTEQQQSNGHHHYNQTNSDFAQLLQ